MNRMRFVMAPEDPTKGGDWTASLPDDLKPVVAAKGFKTPADVLKSYQELEAFRGQALRMPGPEASEADKKEFQEKLAKLNPNLVEIPPDQRAPKDPSEYSFEGVTFEPGTEPSPEEQKGLRDWAKGLGLSKAGMRAELERLSKARAEGAKATKANEAALRQAYGPAYDDKMKGLALLAEKISAPDEIKKAIAGKTISQAQAQWLEGVGQRLGLETRELAALSNPGTPKLTPREAGARKEEIMRRLYGPEGASLSKAEQQELMAKALEYQAIEGVD